MSSDWFLKDLENNMKNMPKENLELGLKKFRKEIDIYSNLYKVSIIDVNDGFNLLNK